MLVIAGREKSAAAALTLEEGVALVLRRREEGMRLKDAVRAVADDTGLEPQRPVRRSIEKSGMRALLLR